MEVNEALRAEYLRPPLVEGSTGNDTLTEPGTGGLNTLKNQINGAFLQPPSDEFSVPSTKESTRNDTLIIPGTSGPNIARTQVDGAPLQTPSDETATRLDAPVLSPFRVAAILIPLAFVIGKAILAYKRKGIVVSNTFDLVIGLAGILVFIVQSFEPVPGKAGGAGPWIFQDISSLVRCSPRIISWVVNTPFGIDIICTVALFVCDFIDSASGTGYPLLLTVRLGSRLIYVCISLLALFLRGEFGFSILQGCVFVYPPTFHISRWSAGLHISITILIVASPLSPFASHVAELVPSLVLAIICNARAESDLSKGAPWYRNIDGLISIIGDMSFLAASAGGIIFFVASILDMRGMPNLGSLAFWAVGIIYFLSAGIWTICAIFWLHRHMRPEGTRAESVVTQTMPGCGLFFYPLTPEVNEPDCVMYTIILATRTSFDMVSWNVFLFIFTPLLFTRRVRGWLRRRAEKENRQRETPALPI